MIILARKGKQPSRDNPVFGDKKLWQAYWYLEELASKREYCQIGMLRAVGYLVAQTGLSERKIRVILRRLSRFPYQWIRLPETGQIKVLPMDKLLKRFEEENI